MREKISLRVICKEGHNGLIAKSITPGRTYNAIESADYSIRVKEDDNGESLWYPISCFNEVHDKAYSDVEFFKISSNMQNFGGSFVSALGTALGQADRANRKILAEAFPYYFQKYLEL